MTMTTVLFAIGLLVGIWLLAGFAWGAISSRSGTRQKQERAQAIILLAQLPEGSHDLLVKVGALIGSRDLVSVARGSARALAEQNEISETMNHLERDPGRSTATRGTRRSADLAPWVRRTRSG